MGHLIQIPEFFILSLKIYSKSIFSLTHLLSFFLIFMYIAIVLVSLSSLACAAGVLSPGLCQFV